jgi:hypothetical protein
MKQYSTSYGKKIDIDQEKYKFFFENNFYRFCDPSRIGKLINLFYFLRKTLKVKGDILEFGVFKGNSAFKIIILSKILKIVKKFYFFDYFSDYKDNGVTNIDKYELSLFYKEAGKKCILKKDFEDNLKKRVIYKNVNIYQGDIFKNLKLFLKLKKKISLINLDVDLHDITFFILNNVYSRLSKNGIIILDDYNGFPGATKAIKNFCKIKKIKINKICNIKTSYFLKK